MYLVIQLSIIYIVQSAAQPETPDCSGCCTSAAGIPGIPGSHGNPGAPGPVGLGLKGDVGVKGDVGLKGDVGVKGEKGIKGLDGRDGLPGKLGPMGLPGAPGEVGLPGATGEVGLPGATGEVGLTGAPGEVGLPGATAEKGERGEKGEQATTNSQPKSAFSVTFNSNPGRLPISPMKYSTIFTNLGSDYNKETGKFVCQHPGTYVFQFTSHGSTSGSIITCIMKNGQRKVCSRENDREYNSASNTIVLDLVADDEVWTQPYSTSSNHYYSGSYAHCTFSGFLLYAS